MNLQNLNLVELNAQEVQEVEGGNPVIRGATLFFSLCAAIHDHLCNGSGSSHIHINAPLGDNNLTRAQKW